MGKIKEKALLDFLPHPITTQGRYTALVPKDTTLDRVLGEVVSYPGHVVCSVDGVPIPHKDWAKTYVRGGQVIQARPRPLGGADGSNPIAAVLTIAVLIAAPYAAAALLPAAAGAGLVAGATAVIGTGGIILVNSLFPSAYACGPKWWARAKAVFTYGRWQPGAPQRAFFARAR